MSSEGLIKTPIVVVPTTFNSVTEEEFANHGANVVIYANHLTRSAFLQCNGQLRVYLNATEQ